MCATVLLDICGMCVIVEVCNATVNLNVYVNEDMAAISLL